jgi:ribosomal protein L31E
MRSSQAMVARVLGVTVVPLSLSVEMSPFWQKAQRILQEVKNIVPEPMVPR